MGCKYSRENVILALKRRPANDRRAKKKRSRRPPRHSPEKYAMLYLSNTA